MGELTAELDAYLEGTCGACGASLACTVRACMQHAIAGSVFPSEVAQLAAETLAHEARLRGYDA